MGIRILLHRSRVHYRCHHASPLSPFRVPRHPPRRRQPPPAPVLCARPRRTHSRGGGGMVGDIYNRIDRRYGGNLRMFSEFSKRFLRFFHNTFTTHMSFQQVRMNPKHIKITFRDTTTVLKRFLKSLLSTISRSGRLHGLRWTRRREGRGGG